MWAPAAGRPEARERTAQRLIMGNRRDIRRLAMQLLYRMDLAGEADRQSLLEELDEEERAAPSQRVQAVDLALEAWRRRADADAAVAQLAPDWPTHRQPPIDRALLRLAYHEIASGRTPAKVAINEAVELAKRYASEHSPAFINGVLDKVAKRLSQARPASPESSQEPGGDDPWLRDAMDRQE